MSSTSTILVCGPSEGKVAVAAAICNYSRLVQRRRDGEGSDVCLPLPASGAPVLGGAFVEHSMELSTKYYVAALKIWPQCDAAAAATCVAAAAAGDEECGGLLTSEGLLLVFDGDAEASFVAACAAWTGFVDASEVALRLCVALQPSSFESGEDQRAKRIEWCLDHGFEYVEVDSARPTAGYDDREKDGMPRVMEALESNLWQSAERKPPAPRVPEPPSAANPPPPAPLVEPGPSPSDASAEDATPGPPPPPPEATLGARPGASDGSAEQQIVRELLATVDAQEPEGSPLPGDVDLERLIGEVSQLRGVAGSLPDEVRREKAAAMAMRLLGALELDDDDSEQDD